VPRSLFFTGSNLVVSAGPQAGRLGAEERPDYTDDIPSPLRSPISVKAAAQRF
jgi:hypothetical protein